MGSKFTTSKRTVFMSCLLGATIVLLVPHSMTGKCQYAFRRVFCVPLGISRSLTLAAKTPSSPRISSQAYLDLQQAYEKLANHTANLKGMIDTQKETIDRLTQLRARPDWQRLSFIPALVFTTLGDDRVVINRGVRDGVQSNCFVLANNAIVGQVTETNKYQATIELISDSGAFLSVFIDTPSAMGIMRGLGQGQCVIKNVSYSRPVEVGQSVYTRNQAGLLGIPMIVGQVSACDRDEETPHFWKIEMTPAVAPEELNQVDIIRPGRS
ncbi:MAG: rod shape-determining protein MreC [Planctomycetes bacterium]|nr:rod shape-determining protein MreC [Planctomycetota bacterium]